ncbi:SDR family NAD(P)-dependent oxidoreductase [Kibdelosporangium phytohabitans]|uniref:3-oxoacyl-ACP reductase n=1 Tax=Kibdelosporangium phytohabitans TaxID=860235 RepID=A0A0N7F4W8_9PSEU|nr:SDR family oxidoreductase [Kibdelosporangium phytohabitans]ALG12591.1 3-oxoacyl-ACP reductase [Kibdelosporangium phytohabitans]MBE1464219.1 3-oxoacyl-[acyl-carrier protein] reductase [Kibdelosporangium phytohabitans]
MTRIVVVTGGSKGIGRAVAERFAKAGDDVVITGRDETALADAARELGVRAVRGDVTSPGDIRALAEQVGERVDVLVNMAGGNTDFRRPATGPALEEIAAAWQANLDANLLGTVFTTTALLPAISNGGAIVNVGSIAAEYAGHAYGAAKAAVQAWTAGLSAEVGPRGVTANTVSPGYIAETEFFNGQLSDDRITQLIDATHDKRAGVPDDVAATVEFLASPGARHITGQIIHVNGGAYTTR